MHDQWLYDNKYFNKMPGAIYVFTKTKDIYNIGKFFKIQKE